MLRILFPVAECVPFAKTGGLADVAGSLPQALTSLGHEVHVVMPLYSQVWNARLKPQPTGRKLSITLGQETLHLEVWEYRYPAPGPIIHFLRYDPYFDRPELYRSPGGAFADNDRRFLCLCLGALELGKELNLAWDIVHCHDWHTAMIPALLKYRYQQVAGYARARSLMTVHNLAYQGQFDWETFKLTGLPDSLFVPEGVEFWGGLNFLKAGLILADWISTVSPTYACEIQTQEYGCGLDGVLLSRCTHVSGILNGVDYSVWNPEADPHLPQALKPLEHASKQVLKIVLLEKIGLYALAKAPVLAMVTRLDSQKGCDILASAMEALMQENLQLIILGTGEKKYHDAFLRFKAHHPRRISLHLEFSEDLAHLIYGGADMFLMPSRYEPCGLGQLISMHYGTIPIVRRTGGLADTVVDYPAECANGFSFSGYSSEALLTAIRRACQVYGENKSWKQLVKNAVQADFSWDRSAGEYVRLYKKMLGKKSPAGKHT